MRKQVFAAFLCAFLLISVSDLSANKSSWQEEIEHLDHQIEELDEIKRGYEGRALRHENQAQRLQFRNSEYLSAKKHWDLAEKNRKIANRIQGDMDALERRKQEILKKHGSK